MKTVIISLIILCGHYSVSFSQAKRDSIAHRDSITAVKVASETVELLVHERVQRIQDSIASETLKLQIANTNEVGKRRALEAELEKKRIADSIKISKIKAQIEASKDGAVGYPVVVAGDTIRMIHTQLGTLAASERAEICTDKIKEAASLFLPAIDSLTIYRDESSIEIMFKDRVLTTITTADALWNNSDPNIMAQEITDRIRTAIIKHKEMTSTLTIVKQIGLSILVVLICYFLIRFINKAFKHRVNRFFLSKQGTWFNGWNVKDYQLMDANRQVRMILFCVKGLRWTLIVFILYLALPILFSIFPMTQRLAGTLFDWIIDPVKTIFWAVVNYMPKLFVILVIWFVMRLVIRGIKYMMNEIADGKLHIAGFYPDWAKATYNIIRILLYAFGFVMMFPFLPGSDSAVFQGVSVFIGIIFSLGSSSVISNIVAGMVITYMRPFKVGDHIKLGDITGDILEKTPFVTRIKTHKQEVVTIPNSNVLSSSVVNYSTTALDQGVIFHITITIGYDAPWRQVHSMMVEAALRSEYVLREPAPFVLQTSLDDFYVSYQLCAYTHNPEKQATIYSALNQNIQDVFNENNIEIASPHYRASRDGNMTTIPEKYRPADYTPPRFVVKNDN